eukprot:TRINITY_DN65715_c0_g1_i1.p1 TRINITY_DN65715_c0_g1~~TRINITY_DN65715_c0_g1_i1.p1  ORF type:complete len:391 (-),score=86.70 TRINITY_DN65715_c0_g1_i1:379-1551(-)
MTDGNKDEEHMLRAVKLAEKARRRTAPNPWVGAILVAEDGSSILGEGFHEGPGRPHAEVEAFKDAEARGATEKQVQAATLYTTLEPCHRGPGKRTPPCDELCIAKKVRRVVVGHVDPCPAHGVLGVGTIRAAGIAVDVGVAESAVHSSLSCYFHHRETGRPYVVVKIATSIDGRVACADGTSQWITQGKAREDAHHLRADSQALLVGSGTALKDRPSLTVRLPGGDEANGLRSQPLRVVLDTRGRVLEGPLLDTKTAPTLIFTSKEHCSAEARALWKEKGVDVVDAPVVACQAGQAAEGLDLGVVLETLAKRGVLQLMVEGGAVLHGSLLRAGLVDELRCYVGATLLGSTAQPWSQVELAPTIGDAKFWKLRCVRQLGDDVCMEYERKRS